jgi:putative hemolysin
MKLPVLFFCLFAAVGGAASAAEIANPASVNCEEKGGKLEIRKSPAGEYGVCIFGANRQCEEWALFRGECPLGGVDISGYKTADEIYCAITGGTPKDGKCVQPKAEKPVADAHKPLAPEPAFL